MLLSMRPCRHCSVLAAWHPVVCHKFILSPLVLERASRALCGMWKEWNYYMGGNFAVTRTVGQSRTVDTYCEGADEC
jgi:hypothetical protein